MNLGKLAVVGTVALGSLGAGADAVVLNETPIQAEYTLKEHVSIKQEGNVVEAVLPWKDQNGLKIKYDMGEPTMGERVNDERKVEVVTEQVSSDAMKIDVLLNEKPKTNRFCYTIEGWEDYDFFLQPALTPEEIAEGAERTEEIVGSYAVYHKTLKNHRVGSTNYETGKVAHIPYPYIWSVDELTPEITKANTIRRAEAFDITDGQMCVTVAQKDLDTMEYPIRVDPTFGYTSIGASQRQIQGASPELGGRHDLSEQGQVTHLSFYGRGRNTTEYGKLGIFSDDNSTYGSPKQQTLQGETASTLLDSTSNQWWTWSIVSPPTLSADGYWIEYMSNGFPYTYYDSASNYGWFNNLHSNTWPTFTSPFWNEGYTLNWKHSIYATYTASGGGSATATDAGTIFFD